MSIFARGTHDENRRFLRSVCAGEAEAVSEWYRAEHPEVYRLAVGFLSHEAEAEDLAQDAMLHLLDRLPTFQGENYRSWRNAVVLNLSRDRSRRLGARRRHEAGRTIPRRLQQASPEHDLHQRELRNLLTRALTHLTPREREVFVLRDLEGSSAAATAEILAISQGTVRSLLSLARRRLRRLLDPELREGDA